MFRGADFRQVEAQDTLRKVIGRYSLPAGATINDFARIFDDVLFSLRLMPEAPREVISKSMYSVSEDSDVLESVRFIIRPSSSHALWVDDMRKVFTLEAKPGIFDSFIAEFSKWIDTWVYHYRLQTNLEALNGVFSQIIQEEGIPYSVSFSLGEGLVDVSDNNTVIGLDANVIENLANLSIFGDPIESRQEASRNSIADALKEANYGYELLRSKATFIKRDLGIYTRKSITKLLREICNRRAQHVRVGVGYYDRVDASEGTAKPGVFAIVERVAATEEEAASYDADKVIISDNTEASSKEKTQNKTKVVSYFRLSPIDRETGVRVDGVTLEQALQG